MLPVPRSCARAASARTRIIEDIPADNAPAVTERVIPRSWCPRCRQAVEPAVLDALPGSREQEGLPHLLRDLKQTQHDHEPEGDGPAFSGRQERLIRDSIRPSKTSSAILATRS